MEPILTLSYSEWFVAEELMNALPRKEGFSVYAPLSRQEKGVDLILSKRTGDTSRVATIQVKYSRAYEQKGGSEFKFGTCFNSFLVPPEADFIVLANLYPHITGSGDRQKSDSWRRLLLVFKREKMQAFVSSLRTKSGTPDSKFYFGFDDPPTRIAQTRGSADRRDYSEHAFKQQLPALRAFLDAPR